MAYNAMKMVCTTRIASTAAPAKPAPTVSAPSAPSPGQRQAYVTQHGYRTLKDAVKAIIDRPLLRITPTNSTQTKVAVQKQCQPKVAQQFSPPSGRSNQRDSFNQHQRGDHAAHIRFSNAVGTSWSSGIPFGVVEFSPDSAPPDRQSSRPAPDRTCTGHRHFCRIGEAITFNEQLLHAAPVP